MARVHETDWQVLRQARLLALQSAPEAFCGNYARELLVHRRTWQRRSRTGTWLVARSGSEIVGLAGMLDEPDPVGGAAAELGTRCIESVWVRADFRRQGVGRQMLRSFEERALAQGVGTLVLWVLQSNPAAGEVYQRLGYSSTGIAQPISIGRREDVEERLMKRLA